MSTDDGRPGIGINLFLAARDAKKCFCEHRDCTCTPEIVAAIETIYTPERHRIVCSWCSAVMDEGTPGAEASHSICPACIHKARAEAGLPPVKQ